MKIPAGTSTVSFPARRNFLKVGLGAAAVTLLSSRGRVLAAAARKPMAPDDPSNTKIAHRIALRGLKDDDILFFQQIGLRWARIEYGANEPLSFDQLKAEQDRFAKYGIKIFSVVHPAYRSLKVQLGQPGRDEDIERYRSVIRSMGKLGIPVASYDFHPANTYTTAEVIRRGYKTREFSVDDFRKKVEKQAFEREYSADDIWAAYTYFFKAVLPAAEEAGVKLALHPDDPPLAKMNGVAKLFTHYDGYARAEKLAGSSKAWGLTFCVGTWMEGGREMGKDVFEMIDDFGRRGKIFEVHFRNVSSPLPRFEETFPDDGYMDMYEIMKALRRVKFTGAAEPDHVPGLTGDTGVRRAGSAYIIAYMQSLLRRANADVG